MPENIPQAPVPQAPAPRPQAPAPRPPAPQPAKPVVPAVGAPLKITKEEKKKGGNLLWGCGFGLIALFVVFILMMIVVISRVGPDSTVLRNFNLNPAGLKQFLNTVISLFFGSLSLLFFVLTIIGIFRWSGAKKTDKEAKSKGMRMTLFSLFPLIILLLLWFSLSIFINRLEIAAERVVAEILVLEPENLEGLVAPLTVTYTSENVVKAIIQNGLSIEFMRWDLDGDGIFETDGVTQPQVTRLYNNRGSINVGLQVKVKNETAPRVYNKVITIVNAVFIAEPPTGIPPLAVKFDASNLVQGGPRVQSFDWDFDGDGKYDTVGEDAVTAAYTFPVIGTYTVHLRVLDQLNNVQNYYRDIEVVPSSTPVLSAIIEAKPARSGPAPLQLQFDAGRSQSLKGAIVNYEWNFGDGTGIQFGKIVTHAFLQPGTYEVTLTVTDDTNQKATSTAEISALLNSSAPELTLTTDPAILDGKISGEAPLKITFDASKTTDADRDIETYEWDFTTDDIVDQAGSKSAYTYDNPGSYTATLNVRDRAGNVGTQAIKIEVIEPGVKAVINATPVEGSVPLIVSFDGSNSSVFEGKIVSYEWDFGDKSPKTITGAKISHKYNAVGSYIVRLKVTSNQSKTAEATTLIYVRDIPLISCFAPSRTTGLAPLSVNFDSTCSSGSISKYSWIFGDGTTADTRKPTHTFEKPGTYTVSLEVADDKSNVSVADEVIVVEGELQ